MLWWASTPARISIRPIIPDPWPRRCGNIGRESFLKDAVKEEHRLFGDPVNAVFVQGGYVGGCRAGRVGGLATFHDGLVAVLEPRGLVEALSGRIGQGGCICYVFDVNFLLIGMVEEVSYEIL